MNNEVIKISQLRRIVVRRWDGTDFSTYTIGPNTLGQDSNITVNVAPRKLSHEGAQGTQETPIAGTFDGLTASITLLPQVFATIGRFLNKFNKATYSGATDNNGNIIFGGADDFCTGGGYCSVIAQGICDDGSSSDIEITRCIPSIDDDIEIGNSSTPEVTVALNPIIYDPELHASDGYPAYTVRMGDNSLTEKQRLNVTTGEYEAVSEEA